MHPTSLWQVTLAGRGILGTESPERKKKKTIQIWVRNTGYRKLVGFGTMLRCCRTKDVESRLLCLCHRPSSGGGGAKCTDHCYPNARPLPNRFQLRKAQLAPPHSGDLGPCGIHQDRHWCTSSSSFPISVALVSPRNNTSPTIFSRPVAHQPCLCKSPTATSRTAWLAPPRR